MKKIYAAQLSYNVSDKEKQQAEKALLAFKDSERLLMQASDYLNIMKTPFKDNPNITPEDINKARAVIRRFRDKLIDNFDLFKESAFQCVNLMQIFGSDTQTQKLIKSFISTIDELEDSVNNLSDLFNDLGSKDFPKNVVSAILKVQDKCNDVDNIINDRIKSHIQTNILATSWVDSISNSLQTKIEQKTPLILDLYNKRQNQLNDFIKERTTLDN